jgi:hypothetical protein
MPSYPRWTTKFEIKPGSWVFVPSVDSIEAGTIIKATIESFWTPPTNYYHLQKGGHVAALKAHCSNKCFIHLDIKDFFGSINKSRISRCLKRPLGYLEARRIAIESTVKHPQADPIKYILPFGFVQSPIIASLCLRESNLGKHLNKLSFKHDIVVTIYMDDIIISMKDIEMANDILFEVKCEADKSKFVLNDAKQEGPALQVTAFNINLSHDNIEIEQERFHTFANDYINTTNNNQREGFRRYVKSVNPDQSTLFP